MKQHLTPSDVAARFGVSVATVARWADSGRLASERTGGGHRRFRVEDGDAFHAATVRPNPEPAA